MNLPIYNPDFLSFLLESLLDGILIVGGDGRVCYGNGTVLRMLDIDKKELESYPFPSFIKDKKLKEFFLLDGEKEKRNII